MDSVLDTMAVVYMYGVGKDVAVVMAVVAKGPGTDLARGSGSGSGMAVCSEAEKVAGARYIFARE